MIGSTDLGGGVYSGGHFAAPDVGAGIEGFGNQDVGMGIPVDLHPGGPVTGVNLDTANPADTAIRALSSMGGRGGFKMPMPMATAPRRPVGSRPEFIYTNPVAAQQASSNYANRLNAETNQERSYNDYLSRLNESQARGEQAAQQAQFGTQEGAANRASAERIAGMGETVRQNRIADAAWQENERAADLGEQTAAMLNSDPNAKVDRKFAWVNPATGKWESRFRRQPRPAQPQASAPGMATPVPAPAGAAPIAVPISPAVAGTGVRPAVPVEPVHAAAGPENPSMLRRAFDLSPAGMAYQFLTQ